MAEKNKKLEIPLMPTIAGETTRPEQIIKRLHSAEWRVAEFITNFAGSMGFVYIHLVWFIFWVMANLGMLKPYISVFDPFPYGLLTMIVSLEAIFLSTFIMITQNRQALVDTYRELEEEKEQREEEREQEELEEEVEDIQKDLDDIKNAMAIIQQKISNVEVKSSGNGSKKSSS